MQSVRGSERFLAKLLLHSIPFLPAIGILAVACGAYAQTSPGTAGTGEHPSPQPVRIVPFREPGAAPSAGPQTAAGPSVTYFGGPIVSNIHIVEVLYGTGTGPYLANISSTTPPSVASFSTAIAASPLFDMLNEYSTAGVATADGKPGSNQTVGHGVFDGLFTINPSAVNDGSTITDDQIQAELLAQVAANNLPAPVSDAQGNSNTVYVLFFPPGKTIRLGTLTSCVPRGFCGYHSTTFGQTGGKNLLYSVLPDMQPPSGCSSGCGGIGQLDSVTNVLTHELAETVTDPDTGLAATIARPLAWVQATDGQEVGDLCNTEQASFSSNGQTYTIQKIFSNFQGDCEVGPPTFGIAGGQNVFPGQQFDLPVTAQTNSLGTIANYTGTVHFSSTDPAASLPADYTFTAADAGFHTFVVSLSTPNAPGGFQTITATDKALPLFTGSANYTVPKSPVASITIAEPGNAVQGVAIPVTVAARDSSNNIVTSYPGTIHFTSSDLAISPLADSTLPNGTKTFSVTFNTTGGQTLVATDTASQGMLFGESGSFVITAPASPTVTALSTTVNPSTFGQSVSYKASVTQSSGGPPNIGMVTFTSDGQPFSSMNVDANGNAQTTATLGGGPHVIFADYTGGSPTHPPSSSLPMSVQVNAAPTTVTVNSTGSPSALGSKIFLNATLTAAAFTPDGGMVTFTDGSTPLAVISPLNGVASFGDTSLTLGPHTITASYSGSTNFGASTSAPFVQVVAAPAPADYTVKADKGSATLLAGQSASFVITTTSINGFDGSVNFACNNLPQLTTCTFTPPTTSVSPSGTTATTTLTVKTTGTNALLLTPQHPLGHTEVYARAWSLSPIAIGVLLLAGARRKKRVHVILGCLMTLLLVTALTSCGGGGSTPPPPPPVRTPAGTTTMVVTASGTASSGNSQPANPNQTLNISITVQ
ncbi:MAG TPA: Ig-like domain-containing protein [Candidatus Angelobacter sp.]